jgi:two-component system chemotaxis sensor kinase CheA
MNDEITKKLSHWLDQLAMELVLAEPGSDRGMLPIRDLFASLRDKSEPVTALNAFHRCAVDATREMEAVMDTLKPFTQEQLAMLSAYQAKLVELHDDPLAEYSSEGAAATPEDPSAAAPAVASAEPVVATPSAPPTEPEVPAEDEPSILLNLDADGELLKEFINESNEHLDSIEQGVLVLEDQPDDADTLNNIFRAFHSFKGGSGFLNLIPINRLSHELESLLDLARQGKLRLTSPIINIILQGGDTLKDHCVRIQEQINGSKAIERICIPTLAQTRKVKNLVEAVNRGELPPEYAEDAPVVHDEPEPEEEVVEEEAAPSETPSAKASPSAPVPAAPQKHPASTSSAKPAEPPAEPTSEGAGRRPAAQNAAVVKVDTIKLDSLIDLVGELVISQSQVAQDEELRTITSQKLSRNLAQLGRITNELQRTAMSLRMVPIRGLFQKMNRLVRDLTVRVGKEIDLQISGEETEMDRTIVEELSDPLMHMIRNSVDHGVEVPSVRREKGKNSMGVIQLKSYHQGGNIVIEITDDGAGLNTERILKKAIEKGIIPPDAQLQDKEIFNLIFAPGFSTAEKVTDLSGRGVGMDVVRRNIEKLRGKVDIHSQMGKGSVFKIYLPLTLAIIDGLVLRVGEHRYILPTLCVRESFRPTKEMISTVHERGEMVNVRGRLSPLLRLYEYFGVESRSKDPTESIVLVVESGHEIRCLLVDDLLNKQEVVIKSLGEQFKSNRALAGAAILGDGQVGLILDPSAIVQLAPLGVGSI